MYGYGVFKLAIWATSHYITVQYRRKLGGRAVI